MNRGDFFKSLIGLGALAVTPSALAQLTSQYEKVYLKQCFVRGFQYYEGPKRIDELNKTGMVELVREPNNKFDKRAIAIHFNGFKIGYLPRESNKTISILMDTQLLDFHVEISHIEKKAMDWEKTRIVVYALKEIKNTADLKNVKPYQVLKTPHYCTLKTENERVVAKIDYQRMAAYLAEEEDVLSEFFAANGKEYLQKMSCPLSDSTTNSRFEDSLME